MIGVRRAPDRGACATPCLDHRPWRTELRIETSTFRLPDFGTKSRREAGGNLDGPARMNLVSGGKIRRENERRVKECKKTTRCRSLTARNRCGTYDHRLARAETQRFDEKFKARVTNGQGAHHVGVCESGRDGQFHGCRKPPRYDGRQHFSSGICPRRQSQHAVATALDATARRYRRGATFLRTQCCDPLGHRTGGSGSTRCAAGAAWSITRACGAGIGAPTRFASRACLSERISGSIGRSHAVAADAESARRATRRGDRDRAARCPTRRT